ncbi:MAG TPA: phenylalanine--tRNA ligase subunit beta [Tepidisphaeraceae bacterium]|nr:phenylalanine--tRNA ligase subunit beta [Tepidisphaeraceae bacterium]
MKTSLSWLSDFVSGPLEPAAVAEALTHGGLNVEGIEGDVLEVEVTSNRGDCLSHVGIAREVAALMNRQFKDVSPAASAGGPAADSLVSVRIDAPRLCPHYTARVIRGVKIGPSPAWLARRLESVGLRPINNVVDVTNYVLFEMGQPLHAFDLAKVGGRKIIVREARAGEKLTTLDGREHPLSPPMLVIADESRPVALAGVMGGKASEVSGATGDILLESARFDPLSIRRTARALAMRSDSSYRFERGIDPLLPVRASLRACQLILETAGGELAAGIVEAGSDGFLRGRKLSLRLSELKRILGISLETGAVMEAFSRLQLGPVLEGETITITVPSWRGDLNIEADLIEEAIRVIGYDKIPVRPEISIRLPQADPAAAAMETIRQTLIGGGYFEAVTFSFVSDALKTDFAPPGVELLQADAGVRSADATLRPSLLPGLLEAVRRNETAGTVEARLFEIGATFHGLEERRKIGLVGNADWRDVRGLVETLLNRLNADAPISFHAEHQPGYAAGACARIEWSGKAIGFIGRIDRGVAEKLSLRHLPVAAELDLELLLGGARAVPQLHPLPAFPAARRDLSLVVDEQTPYERIETALRQSHPADLEAIEYVTTYRGKPLPTGKKSVTVTLVFRSARGTLTGEQVESAVAGSVAAATTSIGASLRE